jgi:hypothetical protein
MRVGLRRSVACGNAGCTRATAIDGSVRWVQTPGMIRHGTLSPSLYPPPMSLADSAGIFPGRPFSERFGDLPPGVPLVPGSCHCGGEAFAGDRVVEARTQAPNEPGELTKGVVGAVRGVGDQRRAHGLCPVQADTREPSPLVRFKGSLSGAGPTFYRHIPTVQH